MKLKNWRKRHGLTQAQLAERLDVSGEAVGGWERGTFPPNPEHARQIIELTEGQVGWEDLYGQVSLPKAS